MLFPYPSAPDHRPLVPSPYRRATRPKEESVGAEGHHDITVVDQNGDVVAKRPIEGSVQGFAELTTLLAEVGDSSDDPIAVAIETPRGLLVAALRARGRPVYPIIPMAVARYPSQDHRRTGEVRSWRLDLCGRSRGSLTVLTDVAVH